MIYKKVILVTIALSLISIIGCQPHSELSTVVAPALWGPAPSARQMAWHEVEFYGFVHFTVNTYTDKEWGF
ncbi:glycoside hydrolase family 29, partial [Planctomycetota bacterium]